MTNEEKSKARLLLKRCKENERQRGLISVNIAQGLSIMMSADFTKEQLETKRKKYINP